MIAMGVQIPLQYLGLNQYTWSPSRISRLALPSG
ncbi:acetyl-CoA acetyltransferase [Vibrio sp. MED222]|nr:acetyl-CoA acetyltransferase [Vibrio sp. MED222]